MDCKKCGLSPDETDHVIKEFSDKLLPLIQEYLEKMPEPAVAAYLIHIAKKTICVWETDYYRTLGTLTEMVTHDLEEIFIKVHKEEEDKKNEL